MKIQLAVFLILFLSLISTNIFYSLKISKAKRDFLKNGLDLPPKDIKFTLSLISAYILPILAILIPMKIFPMAILCACSIFGMITVFRERLDKFDKN